VSLGCPEALVDSERSLTRLRAEGYTLAESLAGADLAIVNACALRGLDTNSPIRRPVAASLTPSRPLLLFDRVWRRGAKSRD